MRNLRGEASGLVPEEVYVDLLLKEWVLPTLSYYTKGNCAGLSLGRIME
jgi:hypothetical protein